MSKAWTAALALSAALVSGCSGSWLPWARSDEEQPKRLPQGAVELGCAQGKKLVLRYAPDGKSVWVFFPDREFRLDRVATSASERYSNGASTLVAEGDALAFDDEGARQYSDCKRKQ
jgi:hypothetical protein